MNYELAKKLKDAGFPQHMDQLMAAEDITSQTAYQRMDHRTFDLSLAGYPETEPDYYTQGKFRPSCIFSREYLDSDEAKRHTLYFPPLEELIKECGDRFVGLRKAGPEARFADPWLADAFEEGQTYWVFDREGKTPREAVANLFLEINKKK